MTGAAKEAAAAAARERFDRLMVEAFGFTHEDYEVVRHSAHTNLEHVQLFGRIVDESGVIERLEQWSESRRKSKAGRKATMSFRTVLVLFIMHMDAGDQRYRAIAKTLFAQTTPETRAYLGLPTTRLTRRGWYERYWRAMNRMLTLLEPWDVPRNRTADPEEYQRAVADYSQDARDRMDEVMNRLLHATVRRLPKDIAASYKGNVAIDATFLEVVGEANPNRTNGHLARLNLDAMSGRYKRGGRHEGQGAKKDKAGWEVETVVTLPNEPGQPRSMPVLTTGMTVHQPGRIKHGPRIAVTEHRKVFSQRGYLIADRAYNGSKPHRFQEHLARMGFRTVFDYKDRFSGKQGAIEDVIQVGGYLYVKWMPRDLVTARTDYKAGLIDRDTYEKRIKAREPYAMVKHGWPHSDGTHRYTYPDLSRVLCFDPATNELVKPVIKKRTFQLRPEDEVSLRIVKNLQAFEHKSDEWKRWYGLRSHVESNNQYVKSDAATDLGNPEKRRPRGYAYQALCAAAAFAVSNLRRIVSFLKAQYDSSISSDKPKEHSSSRTD
ncbi:hypothetical protein [Microbacterium sp. zg.Y1084]|uniref:hypothetical protein n=1 Tax=Microbacterium sp. zg.Y1084 TaxID=2969667 RepID=UPI00214CB609|nr:hypothetical protein [Microbacterium sp. zg.Y1084]MCR2813029.1 hypothetical protein [Microbacterium sp. zg.Y1084]